MKKSVNFIRGGERAAHVEGGTRDPEAQTRGAGDGGSPHGAPGRDFI